MKHSSRKNPEWAEYKKVDKAERSKINKGQLVGIKENQTMEQSNNLIYNS